MSTQNSSGPLTIEQGWIILFAIHTSLNVSSNLRCDITSITGGQSSCCLLSLSTQWNCEFQAQSLAGMLAVLKGLHTQAFDMERICHRELIWAEGIVHLV